jgi:hypothetical protein
MIMKKILNSKQRKQLYDYLVNKNYPRVTLKILLDLFPDGNDRLTIALGKGSEYDYNLLKDEEFRLNEIKRLLVEMESKKEKIRLLDNSVKSGYN